MSYWSGKIFTFCQIDEHLDLQIRHGGTLTNWAARRVGNISFEVINSLGRFPFNHLIRDVPGIQKRGIETHLVYRP